MIAWLLLACAGPDAPARDDSAAPSLEVVLDPVHALPAELDGHHVTVALRDDGTALAVHSDGDRLRATLLGDQGPVPTAFDAGANHGQVRATPDGWVVAATLNGALALAAQEVRPDGVPVEPAVLVDPDHPYLPDLATSALGGFVVGTDLARPACHTFQHPLGAVAPAPCPARVDPEAAIGTLTAALGPDGPIVAWTELHPEGSLTVRVAPPEAPPFLAAEASWGAGMAGRPMLALDEGRILLVWRGAEGPEAPVRSHLAAFTPDGVAIGAPWSLGEATSERPAMAGPVDGLLAVAWEEADRLWLQLRHADDLSAATPPTAVDDETDRVPRRPALDLLLGADGAALGVITWEAALPGSDVESDGREGRARTWSIAGTATSR